MLDLEEFEDIEPYAYRHLTLEFFSTVTKHDNGKYLTACLKGKEYKSTDKVLCDIYKFDSSITSRHSPMGFIVDPHWAVISPCETYKKSGPSSGFISDVALVYLKDTLFDLRHDSRHGLNLGHVVAKLVEYFGVEIDESKIYAKLITKKDLWHAGFLKNSTTPNPIIKRTAYKAYCEEMGIPLPDDDSKPAASTSTGPASENPHDEDEDELDAENHPTHETFQPPPLIDAHIGASSQSVAPAWFSAYEARNEARWTTFTEQNDARWTSFVESNDARWTEQTNRWNEFVQSNEAHWTTHDSRWDTWADQQYQHGSVTDAGRGQELIGTRWCGSRSLAVASRVVTRGCVGSKVWDTRFVRGKFSGRARTLGRVKDSERVGHGRWNESRRPRAGTTAQGFAAGTWTRGSAVRGCGLGSGRFSTVTGSGGNFW
ncbi:ribosomal protein S24/S35 [Striga asiatica]|uniref:Ribosomal protein S24/S35 n=1 Tax=Striga asiatica TaxID=4170 RepID=A0A5A7PHA0_STRAF|nr:ribosomal protein S24/S35 [Striga asiatica]